MGADNLIAAVGAALPVPGSDPVATLHNGMTGPLPAAVIAPPAELADIAELSVTGKLLAALLQASPSAAASLSSAPLLTRPTAQANVIAEAIDKGIAHSGLFYESHLADWVAGRRELESLKQEPQANAGSSAEVPAILRQQLEILDSQPLQWRGELWPGLPVQLQIHHERHPAKRTRADEVDALAWSTTLFSKLPSLGTVTAKIRIDGDRLQLKLQAADAGKLLAERSPELRQTLARAGLNLQRFDANDEQVA